MDHVVVLLCRRHHRAVHEGGFRVVLGAAGEVRFVRPDGRPLEEAPPLPEVTGPPLAPVVARLERAGVRVGPQTGTPAWRGSGSTSTGPSACCGVGAHRLRPAPARRRDARRLRAGGVVHVRRVRRPP